MKVPKFILGFICAFSILCVFSFSNSKRATDKTVFVRTLLGEDDYGNSRYLYTGTSTQLQPPPIKTNDDLMFIIDTGEWFYSQNGAWIKSEIK